jgi:TP901 family phage tail tape measure protein
VALSDIQLNIIVNVRNAQSLAALNQTLNGIASRQATMARSATASAAATTKQAAAHGSLYKRLDAVEHKYDSIFRASYRLMNVGYQLVGAAKAVFGAITDMTDAWGAFEFTTNRAAGALQIWKGSAESINPVYEALIQNLLASSKELRLFPAEEVAKATYFWGSTTGQTVRNMADLKVVMEAINPLMKVAALTQTSYEQAIKGTYSIITQYGKSLTDVDDITAKLFLATQRTALEFGDLINSFKYVGPTAHALGITFEEVTQVLGALGDAGLRGSMSGRGLRQMFIRLVKPPEVAAQALDSLFKNTVSLGKSFDELVFPNGKFVGITKFVNYLAIALKDATSAQRNNLYAVASTANELPVITALVENQIKVLRGQTDAYDMNKASVSDAANAAMQFKKNWELLAESWKGLTGRLTRGVEVIKIQVGRVLAGALAESVKRLTEFIDRIERWVRRNPEIIKTLGQLGAALAAVAGIAGGMFLLSGAMLGVYAAIQVIVRGFGPLAGVAGGVLGTLVIFAESIIDNWTRVQRIVVPAINRFLAALTGGSGIVSGATEAWAGLHSTFKSIVDFIVKQGINALRMVLDFLTMIAESPIRPVLEAIGKAMVVAFGLRSLAGILGLAAGMQKLLTVLWLARAGMVGLAVQGQLVGIRAVFAAKGIGSLTLALRTMGKTSVLLILTALVAALDMLGDIFPSTSKGLEEVRNEMQDFYFELGDSAAQWFDRTMDAASGAGTAFKALAAQVDSLRRAGQGDPATQMFQDFFNFGTSGNLSELQATADEAERVWIEYRARVKQNWEGVAADVDRSVNEIQGFVERFGTSLFGDLAVRDPNLERTTEVARAYFKALQDGTELTAQGAVDMWNSLAATNVNIGAVGKEAFLKLFLSRDEIERHGAEIQAAAELAKAKIAVAAGDWGVGYQILNGLRADASMYGSEFNATVSSMLAGIPQATSAVMEEAVGLLGQAPKEMLTTLITAFKDLGNIKDRFATAMKQKISVTDLADAIIGDIGSAEVTKGLESTNLSMNLWAQGVIDTATTSFTTAVAAYTAGGKTYQLEAAIEKALGPKKIMQILTGKFKGRWWGNLSTEQQIAFQNMANWWAEQPGNYAPTAEVVEGVQTRWNSKIAQMWRADFTETTTPAEVDPLADLVAKMKTSLSSGQTAVDAFKQHVTAELSGWALDGEVPMQDYAAGMTMAGNTHVKPAVNYITGMIRDNLMGNSPPVAGPLVNIVTGGRNVIQSWAQGLLSGMLAVYNASRAIGNFARAVFSPPSLSLYTGGYKVMQSWVLGMMSYWYSRGYATVLRMMYMVKATMIGDSPPPMGPLKTIDKGGYNIVKAWAQGIDAGGSLAVAAASRASARVNSALNIAGMNGGQPISFDATNKRLLEVKIDVSSKDGSVSQVDMNALSESLIPELIRSMEHIASVAD